MSYNKCVFGQGKYDNVIKVLDMLKISYVEEQLDGERFPRGSYIDVVCHCMCTDDEVCECCQGTCDHTSRWYNLRRATITLDGLQMVIEEYLAVKTGDCDSDDEIGLAVYPEGARPELKTEFIPA